MHSGSVNPQVKSMTRTPGRSPQRERLPEPRLPVDLRVPARQSCLGHRLLAADRALPRSGRASRTGPRRAGRRAHRSRRSPGRARGRRPVRRRPACLRRGCSRRSSGAWLAEIVCGFSGSQTTMSASEPGAIVPLRGYRPKDFAAFVETSSTKRFSESRPSRTPKWCSMCRRFSIPGPPFGIFEKSSLPSVFCPSQLKGQWSVETTESTSVASACQRCSWFSFGLRRRRVDVLAALEVRLIERGLVDEEVLRAGLAPRLPALRARLVDRVDRLLAGDVDDVERAAGDACQLDGPVRRLALGDREVASARARSGSVLPSATAFLTSTSIASPFSACTITSAPGLGGDLHRPEERLVVHHDGALVGHEQLVGGHALVREPGEILQRPAVTQVGDADVEADVDHRLRSARSSRGTSRAPSGNDSPGVCMQKSIKQVVPPNAAEIVPEVKSSQVTVPPNAISRCVCGSMAPGMTTLPVASITLSAWTSSDSPTSVDRLVVGEDVADVVVRGGDDPAALDQHGHVCLPSRGGPPRTGRTGPTRSCTVSLSRPLPPGDP